ncbi:MAG: hypothetical protein QG638_2478, partial [Pseudomonadota bacterium]|nr:hypothetical protein [Pseudomonadota bacterium]
KIFRAVLPREQELLSKFVQAGPYLLAAYHSPYKDIVECVRVTILDAANLYCAVCETPTKSPLGRFPEVQLLALLTALMRHSFEYEFFKRALMEIETDLLLSVERSKVNAVAAFFVAAIRAGLGCTDAFAALLNEHVACLPLSIRLGISHASVDANVSNDAIKKLEKKLNSAGKGNPGYVQGVKALYDVPLEKRSGPTLI